MNLVVFGTVSLVIKLLGFGSRCRCHGLIPGQGSEYVFFGAAVV